LPGIKVSVNFIQTLTLSNTHARDGSLDNKGIDKMRSVGVKFRVIGEGIPYLDGAEDELLEFMKSATDRSVGSDELAQGIHDWPSMYHLSPARANLLLPFSVGSEHRVLDVGCGTGTLTRQFAEWGSNVTGLEGSLARCLVANERLNEFENVEIVNGSLKEYLNEGHSEEFDVILLCGVLEYSGANRGGSDGPNKMLSGINHLLKPNGIVIIAIENQLGMKYLLGYNEDHLGVPWVGLSDYHLDHSGVRTWSRSALEHLLSKNGLSESRWYGSFPDYKLPTAIVSDDLWDLEDGKQLAHQFVRNPISDASSSPQFLSDSLSFWKLILQTESPQDFVNSHLVVASKSKLDGSSLLREGLIWTGHGTRKKKFSTRATLYANPNGLEYVHENRFAEVVKEGALHLQRNQVAVVVGDNMEDWIISQSRSRTLVDISEALKVWWDEALIILNTNTNGGVNFDVLPRNFVRDLKSEKWIFIDSEWTWHEPVAASTILIRSLFYLFLDRLNFLGIPKFSENKSLGETIYELAELIMGCKIEYDLKEFAAFEAKVQAAATTVNDVGTLKRFSDLLNTNLEELRIDPKTFRLNDINFKIKQEAFELAQELDSLRRLISNLENSLSWKFTSPMRFVARKIKIVKSLLISRKP
jgi:2-polyprenyl-3-methyl-5-hydroxy-6-metoxy-1,4-benzoquinol methylase